MRIIINNEEDIVKEFIDNCKNKKINLKSKKEVAGIEKELQKIFSKELLKMQNENKHNPEVKNLTLQFLDDYTIRDIDAIGGYEPTRPPIIKFGRKKLYEGLDSKDPDKREQIAKEIVMNLIHEMQHHRQLMNTQTNPPTKEKEEFGNDFKIRSYKDFYQKNYWATSLETDAEAETMKRFQELTGRDEKLEDKIKLYEAHRRVGQYIFGTLPQEKDDVRYKIIKNGVKKPKEIVKDMNKYEQEILNNNSYDINEKTKLINGMRQLHYELLYRALKAGSQQDVTALEQEFGKDNMNKIYKNMYKHFENEKQEKITYAKQKADMLDKIHSYNGYIPPEIDERKPQEKYEADKLRFSKYYTEKMKYVATLNKTIDTHNLGHDVESQDKFIREKEKKIKENRVKRRKRKNLRPPVNPAEKVETMEEWAETLLKDYNNFKTKDDDLMQILEDMRTGKISNESLKPKETEYENKKIRAYTQEQLLQVAQILRVADQIKDPSGKNGMKALLKNKEIRKTMEDIRFSIGNNKLKEKTVKDNTDDHER